MHKVFLFYVLFMVVGPSITNECFDDKKNLLRMEGWITKWFMQLFENATCSKDKVGADARQLEKTYTALVNYVKSMFVITISKTPIAIYQLDLRNLMKNCYKNFKIGSYIGLALASLTNIVLLAALICATKDLNIEIRSIAWNIFIANFLYLIGYSIFITSLSNARQHRYQTEYASNEQNSLKEAEEEFISLSKNLNSYSFVSILGLHIFIGAIHNININTVVVADLLMSTTQNVSFFNFLAFSYLILKSLRNTKSFPTTCRRAILLPVSIWIISTLINIPISIIEIVQMNEFNKVHFLNYSFDPETTSIKDIDKNLYNLEQKINNIKYFAPRSVAWVPSTATLSLLTIGCAMFICTSVIIRKVLASRKHLTTGNNALSGPKKDDRLLHILRILTISLAVFYVSLSGQLVMQIYLLIKFSHETYVPAKCTEIKDRYCIEKFPVAFNVTIPVRNIYRVIFFQVMTLLDPIFSPIVVIWRTKPTREMAMKFFQNIMTYMKNQREKEIPNESNQMF